MLSVVAEGYEDPLELSARRDRFTCEDFSIRLRGDIHAILIDSGYL
jgi:hypothetical protein